MSNLHDAPEDNNAAALYIIGFNTSRPGELSESQLQAMRGMDRLLVPSPAVARILEDAGLVGPVVVEDDSLPNLRKDERVAYCGLGVPSSADPRARALSRKAYASGLSVAIRESHPLSWQLRREMGGDWPREGEDPGLHSVGPAELSSQLCGGEALWVESLYTDEDVRASIHALRRQYPPQHRITAFDASPASFGVRVGEFALRDAESEIEPGGMLILYVPELPLPSAARRDLVPAGQAAAGMWGVVHRLRAPGGCPWDRKQDHASLRPFLLEESHELAAVLEGGDASKIREELGDVLLQIVLHAVIACERGDFTASEVMMTLVQKMTERHPHVFADVDVEDADDVEMNWERIKGKRAREAGRSYLAGIPRTLPALLQAEKMQSVASRVGFDWNDVQGPAEKIAEESREFARALQSGDPDISGEELGDLLFSLVNAARHLDLSAETELLGAVEKFRQRFAAIEEEAERRGTEVQDMTLREMDDVWDEQKRGK